MGATSVMGETWDQLCADPYLGSSHYRFEITPTGKILVTFDEPGTMQETWDFLCADPHFSNTTHKFEITPEGKIIMSPTLNYHGYFQTEIAQLLVKLAPHGRAASEIATETPLGLFAVDVTWTPADKAKIMRQQRYANPAAEICVEIESPSNTTEEFKRKRDGLFKAGALEFWVVNQAGAVSFYAKNAPEVLLTASPMIPMFPRNIPS